MLAFCMVQKVIMFYCCLLLNQMAVGLNIGLHVCHDIQCKAAFFLLILICQSEKERREIAIASQEQCSNNILSWTNIFSCSASNF